MQTSESTTITVGVDGSEASARALVWAIGEAVQGGFDVAVLTAWPANGAVMVHEVPGHASAPRSRAVEAQLRTVAHARSEVHRWPALSARIENERPLDALLAASASSYMLVLGAGEARHHRFGVGSPRLVDRCFDDAPCAVAVVSAGGGVHQRQARAWRQESHGHPG